MISRFIFGLGIIFLIIFLSIKIGFIPCFEITNFVKICSYPEDKQDLAEKSVKKYLEGVRPGGKYNIYESYSNQSLGVIKVKTNINIQPCCSGNNLCYVKYIVNETKVESLECSNGERINNLL